MANGDGAFGDQNERERAREKKRESEMRRERERRRTGTIVSCKLRQRLWVSAALPAVKDDAAQPESEREREKNTQPSDFLPSQIESTTYWFHVQREQFLEGPSTHSVIFKFSERCPFSRPFWMTWAHKRAKSLPSRLMALGTLFEWSVFKEKDYIVKFEIMDSHSWSKISRHWLPASVHCTVVWNCIESTRIFHG